MILNFLDHLEQQRRNQTQSRNVRLAAIRSFFRLVPLRDPASLNIVSRVTAIPLKRADKRMVGYLTREEMDAILDVPNRGSWSGAARLHLATDVLQQRRPGFGDYISQAEPDPAWPCLLPETAWEGKKRAIRPSLAQNCP